MVGHAAAQSISGDHNKIQTLEQKVAADGARAQRLMEEYNAAEGRVQQTAARLVATRRQLATARAASAAQALRLRQVAVAAYVDAGTVAANPLLAPPSSGSEAASVYASVAAGRLSSAVASYQDAQHHVRVAAATLEHQQTAEEAAVRQLRPAAAAAQRAVAQDNALLLGTKSNLHQLLVAAAARHAAEEAAAERALAARAARAKRAAEAAQAAEIAASARAANARVLAAPRVVHHDAPVTTIPPTTTTVPASTASTTPASTTPASGGGYANPLRAVAGLSPERIDQGVDFGGVGPIYAIGDGRVISTVNGGWPGGTFIAYQLTDGPAAGLVVFAAEDISPSVYVGESVTANTVLGTMYGGPDGIETGWANGGAGDTMAMTAGQFNGYNSTAFGVNFSQLLQYLGAPGGILQGYAVGSLPAGWPGW